VKNSKIKNENQPTNSVSNKPPIQARAQPLIPILARVSIQYQPVFLARTATPPKSAIRYKNRAI